MRKQISQREARRLRKRVVELEQQASARLYRWAQEWPGGVAIGSEILDPKTHTAIVTVRTLRHAVVALPGVNNSVTFMALELPR